MKKHTKIIIIISIVFLISLITILVVNNKENKHFIRLNYDEVIDKISAKETFILVISQTTCSHCKTYKPKIEKVLENNSLTGYYIEYDTFSEDEKKEFLTYVNFESTPTTVFIKDGIELTAATRIIGTKSEEYIIAKLKSNGFLES